MHEMKRKKCAKWKEGRKCVPCFCRCKTHVLYPTSSSPSHPPTKTLMLMSPSPAGGAHGGRPVTRWERWSCCISGCFSWGSLSTAPARARSGAYPASHTLGGHGRLRWLPWDGSTAGQFHLEDGEEEGEKTFSLDATECVTNLHTSHFSII